MANEQRYRVVLRTDSHLRLMERPADDPVIWNLNTIHPGEGTTEVSVRDEVNVIGTDVPVHVGLVIVVDRNATSLEDAVEKAENDAAVTLALLSAGARAPTSNRRLLLAYDVTPGASSRRIRQWFWDTPFVLGKTSVPQPLFGDLFQSFTECTDEKLLWRLSQSISWHQRALTEPDAVNRFMGLWIACEALEPRLREIFTYNDETRKPYGIVLRVQTKPLKLKFERQRSRLVFPGLKALAQSEGADGDLVKSAYTLRNDLFHSRRIPATTLITRARDVIPGLETLLPSGWARLLGISERTHDFPEVSVVPHAVGMFFDAELLDQNESQWDVFRHPHFVGKIDAVRKPSADPRGVSADYPTNLTVQNISGDQGTWRGLGAGIVGPSGPNVGTGSLAGPPTVIRGT